MNVRGATTSRRRRGRVRFAAVGVAIALVAAACGDSDDDDGDASATTTASSATVASSGPASATGDASSAVVTTVPSDSAPAESSPGVTADTIKIGFVSSFTGEASSTFAQAGEGAKARVELQNEMGGVNGRMIELITADDQSTTQGLITAVQNLVEREEVFGVASMSSYLAAGYQDLQEQGIPVTGGGFDGPEWGELPNTNMFSWEVVDPTYPTSSQWGEFLKSIGVTKMAGLGYAESAGSIASLDQILQSAEAAGIENAYRNVTLPFGAVDFTAIVLEMKRAGVDGFICSCVLASELALVTAASQAGLDAKGIVATGYTQSFLDDEAAVQGAQGAYFVSFWKPFELKEPGTEAMLAALEKYSDIFGGGIPDYGVAGGYLSLDLMIEGLEVAGANPTRESFISQLRTVTDYDAGGVLSSPIDFSLEMFGKSPETSCRYFVQLQGDSFLPLPKICGGVLPSA
jgi:branched-chain amino acid transport system substrate-binding protein